MRILIAGSSGGTHVGASFERSAREMGHEVRLLDVAEAYRGPRLLRALAWRMGRQPLGLTRYAQSVLRTAEEWRPDALVSAGAAPITAAVLKRLDPGIRKAVYLTDDPWNTAHRAPWFLAALPVYDKVYTTKTALREDLGKAGCRSVEYLPFAYDPAHFHAIETQAADERGRYASEVLFYGGADTERILFIKSLINQSVPVTLYGGYWDRDPVTRAHWRGLADPGTLRKAVAASEINLCLVRRSNRDGHSMRTFEIPALGGYMIVEDTAEHRAIFGEEGRYVHYFKGITDAAALIRRMMDQPAERKRMAADCRRLITGGQHTYTDRLRTLLAGLARGAQD